MAPPSGRSASGQGELLPSSSTSGEGSQDSLPPTFSEQDNPFTPRGRRFPSLGEAHRGITGRSTSGSVNFSRKVSSSSIGTDLESSFEDIPLQDLDFRRAPNVNHEMPSDSQPGSSAAQLPGRSLTHGPRPRSTLPNETENYTVLAASSSLPAEPEQPTVSGRSTTASVSSERSERSDNTVDRIYKSYRMSRQSQPRDSDDDASTVHELAATRQRNSIRSKDGDLGHGETHNRRPGSYAPDEKNLNTANTKDGAQDTTADFDPKWSFPQAQQQRPSSAIPSHILRRPGAQLVHESETSEPSMATTDAENLLNGTFQDAEEDEWVDEEINTPERDRMRPMPLRLNSVSDQKANTSYLSGPETSACGATTESDDDPFKYDNKSFTLFLRPSKEREVSQALRRVSGVSGYSRGTLCSPEGSRARFNVDQPLPLPKPDEAFYHRSQVDNRRRIARARGSNFFDPAVIQEHLESDEHLDGVEVKVAIRPAPSTDVPPTPPPKENRNALNAKNLGLGPHQLDMDRSDEGEWETVATSGVGITSGAGVNHPMPAYNRVGNSLADVSDDVSEYPDVHDDFASTDRIVQHPANDGSPQSYRKRRVIGSNIPVLVANTRVHRVNGFAQDSNRMLYSKHPSTPGTPGSVKDKVTSTLRQFNERRKHRFSPHAYRKTGGKSKFAFRDSHEVDPHDDLEYHYMDQQTSRHEHNGATSSRAANLLGHSDAASRHDPRDSGRMHSFDFNLVSLREAAALQKDRRESGQDDQTVTGSARARQRSGEVAPATTRKPKAALRLPYNPLANLHKPRRAQEIPTDAYSALSMGYAVKTDSSWRRNNPSLLSTENSIRPAAMTSHPAMTTLDAATGPSDPYSSLNDGVRTGRWNPDVPGYEPAHLYTRRDRDLLRLQDRPAGASFTEQSMDSERGVPLDYDDFVSLEARSRRKAFFCLTVVLSVLPFFPALAVYGMFDPALSWYTHGEVGAFTYKQSQTLRVIMWIQFVVTIAVIVLAVYLSVHRK